MVNSLTPSKRQALLSKLSQLRRRVIELLRDPQVRKNGLIALKLALSTTGEVAEACGFSPLKGSVGIISENIERFELSDDVQEDLIIIARKIEKMVEIFERYLANRQEEQLSDFMISLTSAVDAVRASIESKLARGRFRRVWEAPDDAQEVVRMLRIIGDNAELFVMNFTVDIRVQLKQVHEELKMFDLVFVKTAQYRAVENNGCTPGTRVAFTGNLLDWSTAQGDDVPPVCWVFGHAGVGKTTIMYTMCRILHRSGLLGGSFFCSREAAERRSMTNIFPTIAQILADVLPEFRSQLVAALKGNKGADCFTPDEQFEILIAKPARDALARSKSPWRPRVLVIDALDECDSSQDTTRRFLDIVRRKSSGLGIRFLIASRPEPAFVARFSQDTSWSETFYMQDIPAGVARQDVRAFLTLEWSRCQKDGPDRDWPTQERVERLALLSDGLFIYASTAWKFVSDTDAVSPADRLEEVLALQSVPSEENVNKMYNLVLSGLWKRRTSLSDQELTRRCLQAITCLFEPLSVQDLSLLLDIKLSHVREILRSLQSVIRVPQLDEAEPVTAFHASFADYLLSSERSEGQPWHIDLMAADRELYLRSWDFMERHLYFNVSGSSNSYLRNDQQPELKQPSGALAYACFRWLDHFSQFWPTLAEIKQLQTVLSTRFLFWLEVLSVLNCVQVGQRILAALSRRTRELKDGPKDGYTTSGRQEDEDLTQIGTDAANIYLTAFKGTATDLDRLATEGKEFLIAFATPIGTSTPHIYISALACTYVNSVVRAGLSIDLRQLPSVSTEQPRHILPMLSLRGHKDSVRSVAISPDGNRLASGGYDNTIRLWDADTGAQIGKPLRGHTRTVYSVAFSPNGKRVASGSSDNTIRMWDVDTGEPIGEPLSGHTGSVFSVAFSLDGKRIASGSSDLGIRMWDVGTGAQLGRPLRNHTSTVYSVVFSPDGKRVASGSSDGTICMWDVYTSAPIGDSLRGHTDSVYSVAFSPDGKRVTSGSSDNTIRLWDVNTGVQIGEPLRGHRGSVLSVAFSPDGQHVASGSYDDTICMWDVGIGAQIGAPLRGHTGSVYSVAFSPDGKRVASGSDDDTIRMWGINASIKSNEISDTAAPFSSPHPPTVDNHAVMESPRPSQFLFSTSAALPGLAIRLGLSPSYRFGQDQTSLLTLDQDGWLRGPNQELMFWVLPEYRLGLPLPGTFRILGAHPVKVDLGGCPLGTNWTQCYRNHEVHASDRTGG